MRSSPRRAILLITGIMASGKSTVAQLLAERLPRSVHVRGDVFRRMIVTGREEMSPEVSADALEQLRLRYRLAAMTSDAYFEAGFTVVVQDIILGEMLSEFVDLIKGRPLLVVVLAPDVDTVESREAARSKTGYADVWKAEELDRTLRRVTPNLGVWIDTSTQTPEDTVESILDRAWTEGRVR